VHVGGDVLLPNERPRRAGGDRDLRPARELEQLERVQGRLLERLVPGDRRDPEELDLGARECEQ